MKTLVVAVLLIGLVLGGVALADWPQFQGPSRNGITTDGKLIVRDQHTMKCLDLR